MNARWLTVLIVVVTSAILSSVSAPQQTAARLYQSGVYAEEIEGDLQKAIGIYEQVLKQFPNDRDTAANAQLHIGVCYERMGLEKARDAYEKVIKNYPGQAAAVAVAREKLDSLLRAAASGRTRGGGPTLRQVQTPPGQDVLGRVSPDGKYLADVGGGTCNVWIADLVTGKQRFLTPADKDCAQGSPYGPRWSWDSTKLAFTWRAPSGARDLRVVPLDGSAPRVLTAGGASGFIEVLDWAPDGKDILAAVFYPDRQELSLVSVADGSTRLLKSFAAGSVLDGRYSPDGRLIAYSRPTEEGGQKYRTRDVFLLPADGSRETPLVQHPADDALVEWLPDGRGILFASDRAGTYDLWSIQIENEQLQGAPILVRRSIGPITPLGLTKDGALYYRTPASFMDVYTVSLDLKTGAIVGPPKKELLPWEGNNRWPDWSPDGEHLAYVCVRPTVVGPFQPGRAREWIVCAHSADTGRVREFPDERIFGIPRWSADGRYLYLVGVPRGSYRLDVESGAVTPLSGGGGPLLRISPDQKWIVYGRNSRIVRRDASTGEELELEGPTTVYPGGLALSPDGSHLAWAAHDMKQKTTILKVMPFPEGTPKEIQQLRDSGNQVAWSPDGRFIYYSDVPPAGGSDWHLWRIPANGGNTQDLGVITKGHEELRVHPDGSRITFAAPTIYPERSQVWVLENFLPARK